MWLFMCRVPWDDLRARDSYKDPLLHDTHHFYPIEYDISLILADLRETQCMLDKCVCSYLKRISIFSDVFLLIFSEKYLNIKSSFLHASVVALSGIAEMKKIKLQCLAPESCRPFKRAEGVWLLCTSYLL